MLISTPQISKCEFLNLCSHASLSEQAEKDAHFRFRRDCSSDGEIILVARARLQNSCSTSHWRMKCDARSILAMVRDYVGQEDVGRVSRSRAGL